jgi:hypothetical protein
MTVTPRADGTPARLPARPAEPGTARHPHHPEPARQQVTAGRHAPASHSARPALQDPAASAATRAVNGSAPGRQARPPTEPPDLEPPHHDHPGSEPPDWLDPAVPGGAWPNFTINGRRASYVLTLAVSPLFKERYPDKSANLRDALHAGRDPQPAPEPDRQADREAGE